MNEGVITKLYIKNNKKGTDDMFNSKNTKLDRGRELVTNLSMKFEDCLKCDGV